MNEGTAVTFSKLVRRTLPWTRRVVHVKTHHRGVKVDLIEHVRERLSLPGLIGARVLLEYGGSRVVLVAEWDSVSSEIMGSAALYRDARLSEILRRSTGSDTAVYTAVEASITQSEITRSSGPARTMPT